MIDSLLRAALPDDLHALVPRLVRECAAREFVVAHVQKRWGELSEGEGNLVARGAISSLTRTHTVSFTTSRQNGRTRRSRLILTIR